MARFRGLLVAFLALSATPAAAQVSFVEYQCDLGGAPAQLSAKVEQVQSGAVWRDGSTIMDGSDLYYEGQLVSASARYSFTGTNGFADFIDLNTNDRFRVQFILQGNYLQMIINPGQDNAVQYMCQKTG